MANALMDGLNVQDQYGTPISQLKVQFNASLLNWPGMGWGMGADFLLTFVTAMVGYALAGLDLLIQHNLFVDALEQAYQAGLDWVYQIVNPLYIGTFMLAVLLLRIYIGMSLETGAGGRVIGMRMHTQTFYDQFGGRGTLGKRLATQLTSALLLLIIIAALMANPFAILNTLFGFTAALSTGFQNRSGQPIGSTASVDGVIDPLLQLVNFGSALSPQCSQVWSQTLASGNSITDLPCLTAAQHDAVTNPGAATVMAGFAAVLAGTGLFFYALAVLIKGSFFICKTLYHVAEVPWRGAILIARPGSDRAKLDSLWSHFRPALTSVGWVVLAIVLGVGGPRLIMILGTGMAAHMPRFLALLIVSGIFLGAAYAVFKYFGKPVTVVNGHLVLVNENNGTTGWLDFFRNNPTVNNVRSRLQGQPPAAPAATRASTKPTVPPVPDSEAAGDAMQHSHEDLIAIDAATSDIDLRDTAVSMVAPVILSTAAGAPVVNVLGATPRTKQLHAATLEKRAAGAHHDAGTATVNVPAAAALAGPARPVAAAGVGSQVNDDNRGPRTPRGRHTLGEATTPSEIDAATADTDTRAGDRPQRWTVQPGPPPDTEQSARSSTSSTTGHPAPPVVIDGQVERVVDSPIDYAARAEARNNDLVRRYRETVRAQAANVDDDASVVDASTTVANDMGGWTQLDEVAADALRRHQRTMESAARFDERARADHQGPPSFFATQAQVWQWEELSRLARIVGVQPRLVDSSDTDSGPAEVYYDTNTNGDHSGVELGDRKGFGDHL